MSCIIFTEADAKIRDYSGRTADYYLVEKVSKQGTGITLRSEYSKVDFGNSGTNKSLRHGKSKYKSFRHLRISEPLVTTI